MSYEKTDINLRPIAFAVVVFVVIAVAVHVGEWFLFDSLRDEAQRRDVRQSRVTPPLPIPPHPRLQVDPYKEWREYRESQQKILESYDWASREQRRVQIPIRRAMELLVERGK